MPGWCRTIAGTVEPAVTTSSRTAVARIRCPSPSGLISFNSSGQGLPGKHPMTASFAPGALMTQHPLFVLAMPSQGQPGEGAAHHGQYSQARTDHCRRHGACGHGAACRWSAWTSSAASGCRRPGAPRSRPSGRASTVRQGRRHHDCRRIERRRSVTEASSAARVSTEDDLRRYYRNRAKRLLDADRKWDGRSRIFGRRRQRLNLPLRGKIGAAARAGAGGKGSGISVADACAERVRLIAATNLKAAAREI